MDRIRCCVPFCRRTAAAAKYQPGTEIICGKHYRLASATWRRRLRAVRRRFDRAVLKNDESVARRCYDLDNRLWARIKAQSIELAFGV